MYIYNSELAFILSYRPNMTTLSLGKKYQQSNVFVPLGFFIFLNDYLLQYSCLENSKDRRAWQAIVHGVTKSWTLAINIFTFTLHLMLLFLFLEALFLFLTFLRPNQQRIFSGSNGADNSSYMILRQNKIPCNIL